MMKIITRVFAVVFAVSAIVVLQSPAHAESTPTLFYPLERVADTADVEVMLQAPLKSWGIRQAAKYYDANIDGLTIHTRGSCALRPLAVCVRVSVGNWAEADMLAISQGYVTHWHGLMSYTADALNAPRTIHLNERYGKSLFIARHELGHALGLAHHEAADGVMYVANASKEELPSAAELDTLRAWYGL